MGEQQATDDARDDATDDATGDATDDATKKQADGDQIQEDTTEQTEKDEPQGEAAESVAQADTEPEPKQDPGDNDGETHPPDGAVLAVEDQELGGEQPESGGAESQREVVTIDGVPVLEDIVEEEEEEEVIQESREELIETIMLAMEESSRLESVNSHIQSDIAEYLARKKVSLKKMYCCRAGNIQVITRIAKNRNETSDKGHSKRLGTNSRQDIKVCPLSEVYYIRIHSPVLKQHSKAGL